MKYTSSRTRQNMLSLDADAARLTRGTLVRQASYTWDVGSRLVAASDPDGAYTLSYDLLDRLITVDYQGTPGVPRVVLDARYDLSEGVRELN